MTTERFADRIVRQLARQDYQPQKIRKLAQALRTADERCRARVSAQCSAR